MRYIQNKTRGFADLFSGIGTIIAGAFMGFCVAGPAGMIAGGASGAVYNEHQTNKAIVQQVSQNTRDIDQLGVYAASKPWEPAKAPMSKLVESPKADWRKSCIPNGSGGLDF